MASKWATVEQAAPREKDPDAVWVDAIRQLRDAANRSYHTKAELTTASTSTLTTIWLSEVIPKLSMLEVIAVVEGKTSTLSERCAYRKVACFYRDDSNPAAQQGATTDVYTPFESNAAFDCQVGVDADSRVFVKVNDGGLGTVSWTAWIEVRRQ